jgi:hypothetical protein
MGPLFVVGMLCCRCWFRAGWFGSSCSPSASRTARLRRRLTVVGVGSPRLPSVPMAGGTASMALRVAARSSTIDPAPPAMVRLRIGVVGEVWVASLARIVTFGWVDARVAGGSGVRAGPVVWVDALVPSGLGCAGWSRSVGRRASFGGSDVRAGPVVLVDARVASGLGGAGGLSAHPRSVEGGPWWVRAGCCLACHVWGADPRWVDSDHPDCCVRGELVVHQWAAGQEDFACR